MPEYEDDQSDKDKSTQSLDNEFAEFDVPIMRRPGDKKALTMVNEKLCRSPQERTQSANSAIVTIYTMPL